MVKIAVIHSQGNDALKHASLRLQENPELKALAESDELKQQVKNRQKLKLTMFYRQQRAEEETANQELLPTLEGV